MDLSNPLDCINPEYPYGFEIIYLEKSGQVIYRFEIWGRIFKPDIILQETELITPEDLFFNLFCYDCKILLGFTDIKLTQPVRCAGCDLKMRGIKWIIKKQKN